MTRSLSRKVDCHEKFRRRETSRLSPGASRRSRPGTSTGISYWFPEMYGTVSCITMTLDDFPGTCIGKFTGRLNALSLRSAAVTHSQFHDPVPCAPARDIMRTLRYGIVPTFLRDSQIFVEIFHCTVQCTVRIEGRRHSCDIFSISERKLF